MSSMVEVQVKIIYTIHKLSTPKTIVITVTKEFSKWQMAIENLLKKDKCWKQNTDKSDIQLHYFL